MQSILNPFIIIQQPGTSFPNSNRKRTYVYPSNNYSPRISRLPRDSIVLSYAIGKVVELCFSLKSNGMRLYLIDFIFMRIVHVLKFAILYIYKCCIEIYLRDFLGR